ncbi:MAG: 3-dehydroquinate synthase family protein [Acidimicrobiia bacterium]
MEDLSVAGVTEVVIGRGMPTPLLPTRPDRRRVAILTQPAVTPKALEIAASLRSEDLLAKVIGLPDREDAKTLSVAESVYEAFAKFGLSRGDTVIGVGGGTVTDLAGFVAGTWMRGVEVVHIPTTLLGAVDASIGGKSGVNLGGKNLVGVIWHPRLVVVDTDVMEALPAALLREGFAEAFKTGLVGDSELCSLLVSQGVSAPLDDVVRRAIRVKAGIVTRDEREDGERAYLNYGHTIGHAIEYASTLSHGESVGLGMIAASYISEKNHGFDGLEMVVSTIEHLGLPTSVDGLDPARVLDLIGHDKKRDGEGLRMVLLREVEDPVLSHVEQSDVELGMATVGL